MRNISVKCVPGCADLDREIKLSDGSIVVQKENEQVIGVYLVIPFTVTHCSFINLDNGQFAFDKRCGRETTERMVLRHLIRVGDIYPYDLNSKVHDNKFSNMRIHVYPKGNYKIGLKLGNEQIFGGTR